MRLFGKSIFLSLKLNQQNSNKAIHTNKKVIGSYNDDNKGNLNNKNTNF